jgi:hypothetical protein
MGISEDVVHRAWKEAGLKPRRIGTLPQCDPFGIPFTSHWTGAAIIVKCYRPKACLATSESSAEPNILREANFGYRLKVRYGPPRSRRD